MFSDYFDFRPTFNLQQFSSTLPEEGVIRRDCFNVFITDDIFYESTESFTVVLEMDALTEQSGIGVDPPITEIFIIDNDGKFFVKTQTPCCYNTYIL